MLERELTNLLDQAERAAQPMLPPGTPLALIKRLVLRGMRVYTRTQSDFNRAVLAALRRMNEPLQAEIRRLESATEAVLRDVASIKLEAQQIAERTTQQLQAAIARGEQAQAEGAAARKEAALAGHEGKRLAERMEWLVQWTDTFRKELFFELRHRLDEHERLTKPEVLDREAYMMKVQGMPDGLRVDLGAGPQRGSQYITVDQRGVQGIDIRADVRHLPFEDGQLAELYCSHLIEHFTDAEMRSRILPYWHRLLRPGGKLVVVCPDAEAMIKRWMEGKLPYDDLREVTFGAQEYEGNQHYNMFTPSSLDQMLKDASFREVRRLAVARVNGKCLEMEFEAIK